MLREAIIRLVVNCLQDLVVDFNEDQLQVSLWNGNVEVENLKLNTDAINEAETPYKLVSGRIGSFKAKVPWSSFSTESIKIVISNVDALFASKGDYNHAEFLSYKQKMIQNHVQRILKDLKAKESQASIFSSITQSLSTTIINHMLGKIQIEISNVSVRYQHDSDQCMPFGFRFTCPCIRLLTINSSHKDKDHACPIIEKRLEIKDLQLDQVETYTEKRSSIVFPMAISVNMSLLPASTSKVPRSFDVNTSKIDFNVCTVTMQKIRVVNEAWKNFHKNQRNRRHQQTNLSFASPARKLWQTSISATIESNWLLKNSEDSRFARRCSSYTERRKTYTELFSHVFKEGSTVHNTDLCFINIAESQESVPSFVRQKILELETLLSSREIAASRIKSMPCMQLSRLDTPLTFENSTGGAIDWLFPPSTQEHSSLDSAEIPLYLIKFRFEIPVLDINLAAFDYSIDFQACDIKCSLEAKNGLKLSSLEFSQHKTIFSVSGPKGLLVELNATPRDGANFNICLVQSKKLYDLEGLVAGVGLIYNLENTRLGVADFEWILEWFKLPISVDEEAEVCFHIVLKSEEATLSVLLPKSVRLFASIDTMGAIIENTESDYSSKRFHAEGLQCCLGHLESPPCFRLIPTDVDLKSHILGGKSYYKVTFSCFDTVVESMKLDALYCLQEQLNLISGAGDSTEVETELRMYSLDVSKLKLQILGEGEERAQLGIIQLDANCVIHPDGSSKLDIGFQSLCVQDLVAETLHGSTIEPCLLIRGSMVRNKGLSATVQMHKTVVTDINLDLGHIATHFIPETLEKSIFLPCSILLRNNSASSESTSIIINYKVSCEEFKFKMTQKGMPFALLVLSKVAVEKHESNGIRVVIRDVLLRNLTGSVNRRNSNAILKLECDCGNRCDMFSLKVQPNGDSLVSFHAIQFNILHQFGSEVSTYCNEVIKKCVNTASKYFGEGSSTATSRWEVEFENVAFLVPRNTKSNDALAYCIRQISIRSKDVHCAWKLSNDIVADYGFCQSEDIFKECVSETESEDTFYDAQEDSNAETIAPKVNRTVFQCEGVEIFSLTGSPVEKRSWSMREGSRAKFDKNIKKEAGDSEKVLVQQAPVPFDGLKSAEGLKWKQVTKAPYSFSVFHDAFINPVGDFEFKTLLYVPEPGFRISMSQDQYNLLWSTFFDNFYEWAQFPRQTFYEYSNTNSYPGPKDIKYNLNERIKLAKEPFKWERSFYFHTFEWDLEFLDRSSACWKFENYFGAISGGIDVSRISMAASSGILLEKQAESTTSKPSSVTTTAKFTGEEWGSTLRKNLAQSIDFIEDGIQNIFLDRNVKNKEFSTLFPLQMSMICLPNDYNSMTFVLSRIEALVTSFSVVQSLSSYLTEYFYDPSFGCPWPESVDDIESLNRVCKTLAPKNSFKFLRSMFVHCTDFSLVCHDTDPQTYDRHLSFMCNKDSTVWYEWDEVYSDTELFIPSLSAEAQRDYNHFMSKRKTSFPFTPREKREIKMEKRTLIDTLQVKLSSHFNADDKDFGGRLLISSGSLKDQGPSDRNIPNASVGKKSSKKHFENNHPLTAYISLQDIAFFSRLAINYAESRGQSNLSESNEDSELACDWCVDSKLVQVVLVNDITGVQEPMLRMRLEKFRVNFSQYDIIKNVSKPSHGFLSAVKQPNTTQEATTMTCSVLAIVTTIKIDFYSTSLRTWEPVLESWKGKIIFDKGIERGSGIFLTSESNLQLNVNEEILDSFLDWIEFAPSIMEVEKVSKFFSSDSNKALCDVTTTELSNTRDHILEDREYSSLCIHNLTGKALRYHQPKSGADKNDTDESSYVLYQHERGELRCPSRFTLVHDGNVVDSVFKNFVEMEGLFKSSSDASPKLQYYQDKISSSSNQSLGNELSVQLQGFAWMHRLPLRLVGTSFFSLNLENPANTEDEITLHELPPNVRAVLMCAITMSKTKLGRSLTLQSVFEVKNSSTLPMHIHFSMPRVESKGLLPSTSAIVPSNGVFQIPLALLHHVAIKSNGSSVGVIYARPILQEGHMQYSFSEPISLLDIIGADKSQVTISCSAKAVNEDESLLRVIPAHHYCMEIKRESKSEKNFEKNSTRRIAERINSSLNVAFENALENHEKISNQKARVKALLNKVRSDKWQPKEVEQSLLYQRFTFSFRPPIIIENLLAGKLICRVDHFEKNSVLWKGAIEVGSSVTVYQVSSQQSLNISFSLPDFQCISTKALRVKKPFGSHSKKIKSVITFSRVGASTKPVFTINVETTVGKGGERKLVIFAPYWLVNLTEYDLRFRQLHRAENSTSQRGCMAGFKQSSQVIEERLLTETPTAEFLGLPDWVKPGLKCEANDDDNLICSCEKSLCKIKRIAQYATMFSFASRTVQDAAIIQNGDQLCFQIADSGYSKPFSVETIGIDQSLQVMHQGKAIEIGIDISFGDGALQRTKIVRFSVRLLFINRLSRLIKVCQGDRVLGEVMPDEMKRLACVDSTKDSGIRVRYGNDDDTSTLAWSGQIDPKSVGVHILKLHCPESANEYHERLERKFDIIAADIQLYSPTMFACLRHIDESAPFYRIKNNLATHDLLYRQAGCNNTSWQVLSAGKSSIFAWDEPLLPHTLKVALCKPDFNTTLSTAAVQTKLGTWSVKSDRKGGVGGPSELVPLDEIGFTLNLATHSDSSQHKVFCKVETDGVSRVLYVSESSVLAEEESRIKSAVNSFSKQLLQIDELKHNLDQLTKISVGSNINLGIPSKFVENLARLNDPRIICSTEKVVIQVISARDVKEVSPKLLSNVYTVVSLEKKSKKSKRRFKLRRGAVEFRSGATYYVENSVNPSWHQQAFTLDVPTDCLATDIDIQIELFSHTKIKRKGIFLGRVKLSLSDFNDQKSHVTRCNLQKRSEKKDEATISGSICVGIQWLRSNEGLLAHWKRHFETEEQSIKAKQSRIEKIASKLQKNYLIGEQSIKNKKDTDRFRSLNNITDIGRLKTMVQKQFKVASKTNSSKSSMKFPREAGSQIRKPLSKKTLIKTIKSRRQSGFHAAKSVYNLTASASPLDRAQLLEKEMQGCHEEAMTSGGSLVISIVKASRIPPINHPTWCSIECHDKIHKTAASRAGFNQEFANNTATFQDLMHESGNVKIRLLTKNTTGSERLIAFTSIALRDLCVAHSNEHCLKWYPLKLKLESGKLEQGLEGLLLHGKSSEGSDEPYMTACIQIQFRWEPNLIEFIEVQQYLIANLQSISVTLIDSQRGSELLRATVEGASVKLIDSEQRKRVSVALNDFQIDNQTFRFCQDSVAPVYVSKPYFRRSCPIFQLLAIQNNERSHGNVDYFDYLSVLVQEFDLTIEEHSIRHILNTLSSWKSRRQQQTIVESPEIIEEVPNRFQKGKVYIAKLDLTPLKINVSVSTSKISKTTLQSASKELNEEESIFMTILAKLFQNVEKAPFQLNALQMSNVFEGWAEIQHAVVGHYKTRALRQLYRFLGHATVVGNPVGLAGLVGVGVRDFFYEPYHGISHGPKAFTTGVAKGTISLISNTTYGIFDSASRLTTGFSNSLVSMSVDKEYQIKRSRLVTSNDKVLNRRLGGINLAIREGIVGGITGVVMEPIREVRRGAGIKGLIRGTGAGITGAIIKPASGALDLASVVTESVRDSANYVTSHKVVVVPPVERKQLCHSFGPDGRILPLSPAERWGYELIRYYEKLESSKLATNDSNNLTSERVIYVVALHGEVKEKLVYVLTGRYLYGCTVIRSSNPTFSWKLNRADIREIALENAGLNFHQLKISTIAKDFRHPAGLQRVREVVMHQNDLSHNNINIGTQHRILIKSRLPPHGYSFQAEQQKIRTLYKHLMGKYSNLDVNDDNDDFLAEIYYQTIAAGIQDLRRKVHLGQSKRSALEQLPWPDTGEEDREGKSQELVSDLSEYFVDQSTEFENVPTTNSSQQPPTSETSSFKNEVQSQSSHQSSSIRRRSKGNNSPTYRQAPTVKSPRSSKDKNCSVM